MKTVPLKVMSYNIRCGVDMSGRLNLKAIGELIRKESPDIAGIQEVDRYFAERSEFQDQAKWLSDYLGYDYAYAVNVDMDPLRPNEPRRQYGTAVLSKHPIERSQNYYMSSFGREQRGIMEARIRIGGTTIAYYNTHFGLSDQERIQQSAEALAQLDRTAEVQIVTGDFNSYPYSEEIKKWHDAGMKDAFAGAAEAEANTFPSDKPYKRIDYIFYDGEIRLEDRTVIDSQASDHRPIVAQFVIAK